MIFKNFHHTFEENRYFLNENKYIISSKTWRVETPFLQRDLPRKLRNSLFLTTRSLKFGINIKCNFLFI